MMQRVLEREVMDKKDEAIAYAAADFSQSNSLFVRSVLDSFGTNLRSVLDLGCGPADVSIMLALMCPAIKVLAVDASGPMLSIARDAITRTNLGDRIKLIEQHLPGLALSEYDFDVIISKDVLHHIPDPADFWNEIVRLGNLCRRDVSVFVMDLRRPASTEEAAQIVERISANESPLLKRDFYNSLLAAFTPDEIEQQLSFAGVNLRVMQTDGHHLCVKGVLRYEAQPSMRV